MSNNTGSQQPLFVQLEDWAVDVLISDEMTKTERRLFWLLFKLDRYGDGVDIPSQSELALQLGVSRKAINQAQAKLERLELWEFKVTKWKGRNLAAKRGSSFGVTKRLQVRKKGYSELPEGYSELPEGYSELPEGYSDINNDRARAQTFSDLNKTFSDSQIEEKADFSEKNPDAHQDASLSVEEPSPDLSQVSSVPPETNYSAAARDNKVAEKPRPIKQSQPPINRKYHMKDQIESEKEWHKARIRELKATLPNPFHTVRKTDETD